MICWRWRWRKKGESIYYVTLHREIILGLITRGNFVKASFAVRRSDVRAPRCVIIIWWYAYINSHAAATVIAAPAMNQAPNYRSIIVRGTDASITNRDTGTSYIDAYKQVVRYGTVRYDKCEGARSIPGCALRCAAVRQHNRPTKLPPTNLINRL